MPGPKSTPIWFETLDENGRRRGPRMGKTEHDRRSGKWTRRQVNRHADPVRESGGKQFKGK